jgi:hypothetical protein
VDAIFECAIGADRVGAVVETGGAVGMGSALGRAAGPVLGAAVEPGDVAPIMSALK